MTIPLETSVFLGKIIPEGCEKVIYNPVREDHLVWDIRQRGYRSPYDGEIGLPLKDFLCVVRKSR